MSRRRCVLAISLVLLAGCTQEIDGVSVTDEAEPLAPLTVERYSDAAVALPQIVADLNNSQMTFIEEAEETDADKNTLDAYLLSIAAHAMELGTTSLSVSQTIAAQGGEERTASDMFFDEAFAAEEGSAAAQQYAMLARFGFTLVLDAQNMRTGLAKGTMPPDAAAQAMAEYGARLWNPGVSTDTGDNPFTPYLADPSVAEPVIFVQEAIKKQLGEDTDMNTWFAMTPATVQKTVAIPAGTISRDPLDPATAESLTSVQGQKDGVLAGQTAAAYLGVLGSPVVQAGNDKEGSVSPLFFKTGTILDAWKIGEDIGRKHGKDLLPVFQNGIKTVIDATVQGAIKGKEKEAVTLAGDVGIYIPKIQEKTPIETKKSPVLISITISDRPVEADDENQRDVSVGGQWKEFAAAPGSKVVTFSVLWDSTLTGGKFMVSCDDGQSIAESEIRTMEFSDIKAPGEYSMTCIARSAGGAVYGSKTLKYKVAGNAASSSASSAKSSAASSAVSSAVSSIASSSSSLMIPSSKSSATSSVVSSVVSSVQSSSLSSATAADLTWIEPYVTGIEKDFLSRGFDEIAVAIVADDLRVCLTAEANAGKSQSQAKSKCAVTMKGSSSKAAAAAAGGVATVSAVFTENISGGPQTVFTTSTPLTADFAGQAVTGKITGTATWKDSYICYNTGDTGEVYQTVPATYTSTYTGDIYAGLNGGSFSAPLKLGGSTYITGFTDFTHEECTHLNGNKKVFMDSYNGAGTINGTVTGDSLWTINTNWKTDDGVVSVSGTFAGNGTKK